MQACWSHTKTQLNLTFHMRAYLRLANEIIWLIPDNLAQVSTNVMCMYTHNGFLLDNGTECGRLSHPHCVRAAAGGKHELGPQNLTASIHSPATHAVSVYPYAT